MITNNCLICFNLNLLNKFKITTNKENFPLEVIKSLNFKAKSSMKKGQIFNKFYLAQSGRLVFIVVVFVSLLKLVNSEFSKPRFIFTE